MIGFKNVEDYTYDECLAYHTEHNHKDSSWEEISQPYYCLLSQLRKEDEYAYRKCSIYQVV